jgi:hypothetical protein
VSLTDPEARIARMTDGTTHLAYKPEHAVDLDTGAVVAAEMHLADQGRHSHHHRHLGRGAAQPDERGRAALFG